MRAMILAEGSTLVAALVVIPTAAVVAAMFVVLWRARTSTRTAWVAVVSGLVLATSAVITAWLAARGAYLQRDFGDAPLVGVQLVTALAAMALLLATSPSLRSLLTNQKNLLRLNLWRLEGAVFLALMITGQMPARWAIPAGVGDILVGALAFPVAGRLDSPGGVGRAIGFNLFGLADLMAAVALGMMTSPGPVQVFHTVPTSELVTHFPLALVPAFLVPMAFMLHIVSLWQLFGLRWVGQRAPRWAASGPALPHSGTP
jgi:hypothetical protein